jgi:RimJ/RimL family protein N-acetyltransferase
MATDRIVLRKFTPSDSSWIADACNRPEMARFVPALPSPYTVDDASEFIAHTESAWLDGTGAAFAIESVVGDPLGAIALSPSGKDWSHAGVGYWLRVEARGRGLATEALQLVSRWAFQALGAERLSLITDPDNISSQRVAERAGFHREGVLRAWHPTRFGRRDSTMFSLLPQDVDQ